MKSASRAAASLALVVGCSASPAQPAPAPPPELARPPARPDAIATGPTRWFVIDRYDFGMSSRDGWRTLGFDLDGAATSADDVVARRTTCHRPLGTKLFDLVDGQNGIDNNFSKLFMATAKSLKADFEEATNEFGVRKGGFTMALRIEHATESDNAHAPGALYLVGRRGEVPTFAPDDVWPLTERAGGGVVPVATFANGYIANGEWVSGTIGGETIGVAIPVVGQPIFASLRGGVIVAPLSGSRGTIAGAVLAKDLRDALMPWVRSNGICEAPTIETSSKTIDAAADLGSTRDDPSRTCDMISVGIGFTMVETMPPSGRASPPIPPEPDCEWLERPAIR